ncbi:hypothetical protein RHGRI_012819 [Rhododendron griersonianum]|uniref:Uncharacterized protein n=1 Tax=Rhododendron griersonianum TaxID=479676 RepID=A0AAV6KSZ5_9ERIC|nr:hypothetical protein RHGRI_012819 [Rhododendron griersonianum]
MRNRERETYLSTVVAVEELNVDKLGKNSTSRNLPTSAKFRPELLRGEKSSTAESSSYAPLQYTAVPLPPSSLDLNLAYLGGGGCCGGVGFTGFILTACPLFFFDKLLCSEALHNRLNMYRFDRKVSDLRFPVAGGVHSDSAFVVPDPRSTIRGDDVGCCSRFRVGTRSGNLT